MGDVLDEAYGIVQCKECPWYKTCVVPMKFTAEDIRRQLESSAPGMGIPQQADLGFRYQGHATAAARRSGLGFGVVGKSQCDGA